MARVAINGLGRIGRAALKIILDTPELDLMAVNDIVPVDNIKYLLKYDTVYGRYEKSVETDGEDLVIDGKKYDFFKEKDPAQLPWADMNVDIVFECTGVFTKREDLEKHVQAGAKYVILSAPAKGEDVDTIVYGVNKAIGGGKIISCASCTTNCITPVVEIMGRRIGIKKAIMTTVHAYTSSQAIVDAPAKKVRRDGRGLPILCRPAPVQPSRRPKRYRNTMDCLMAWLFEGLFPSAPSRIWFSLPRGKPALMKSTEYSGKKVKAPDTKA